MIHRRFLPTISLALTLSFGLTFTDFYVTDLFAQGATSNPAAKPKQAQKQSRFVSSNWTVACQPDAKFKKMVCELSKAITDVKSKQLLVRAFIQGDPHQLVMQLPHGLALNAGVLLQIDDGQTLKIGTATSAKKGIFTKIAVSAPLLAALKKGKQMKITVSAMNGKKIIIPIGLNGFSIAFDKFN